MGETISLRKGSTEQSAYGWVHYQLRLLLGSARNYPCVDCGWPGASMYWSYDGADPDELSAIDHGLVMRYSLKLEHYAPRCGPCHWWHDHPTAERRCQCGAVLRCGVRVRSGSGSKV